MKVKALFGHAFQVAFSSATIEVVRNQVQSVMMDVLFVAEKRFSGYALSEKNSEVW